MNDKDKASENEETVVGERKEASPDSEHRPHEWPVSVSEHWCSCCRQAIIEGLHNVVRIATTPEKQLSIDGKELGEIVSQPKYKAYVHAKCWKRHFGVQADCEKCGGFSTYTRLQDGSQNKCACTCHKGSNHCSFILEPNHINNSVIRQLSR